MSVLGKQVSNPITIAISSALALSVVYLALIMGHAAFTNPIHVTKPTVPTHSPGLSISQAPTAQDTQQAWLNAINSERQKAGIAPLQLDPRLNASAAEKAASLASEGIINGNAHVDSSGKHGITYIQAVWPQCTYGAENIAWDYTSIPATVAAWMASPEHRTAILDPTYTYTGFAESGSFDVEHFCGTS